MIHFPCAFSGCAPLQTPQPRHQNCLGLLRVKEPIQTSTCLPNARNTAPFFAGGRISFCDAGGFDLLQAGRLDPGACKLCMRSS